MECVGRRVHSDPGRCRPGKVLLKAVEDGTCFLREPLPCNCYTANGECVGVDGDAEIGAAILGIEKPGAGEFEGGSKPPPSVFQCGA